MSAFRTSRLSDLENFPYPADGAELCETCPTLVWLCQEGAKRYTVRIFRDGKEYDKESTDRSFLTIGSPLAPGVYTWTVASDNGLEKAEERFTVREDAVTFLCPTAGELYDAIPNVRPRDLFFSSDLPALQKEKQTEWRILQKNLELAYRDGMPDPPHFHTPEYLSEYTGMASLPYREYFGRYRDYVDRDLVACSLAYAVYGDGKAGEHAKRLLLKVCSWNPAGPCAQMGGFGDEVGLSNARCLPAVFDLLYPLLDEKERRFVAGTVAVYADECYRRLQKINYAENPSCSHAGRLPAYLGEAAVVLKGTGAVKEETLLSWLSLALEIYGGIFPFYGTPDGAWAEGVFYASSYTKWYLPFFSAVRRFTGKDLLSRPFYRNYVNYIFHFADPKRENHPFGDGYWCRSKDAEWPGFFAQNPFRVYADGQSDPALLFMQKSCELVDHYELHLLDLFLPKREPSAVLPFAPKEVAVFPLGGFAAMHSSLGSPDDILLLARASRYPASSHRHPDQGSFALFAGPDALISPSGYFGRQYGSLHHRLWTNASKAHNVLLIDGIGQPYNDPSAVGKILSYSESEKRILLDLSAAYPNITLWQREIRMFSDGIEVTDRVEAGTPVAVTCLLHTLSAPESDGNDVLVTRGSHSLRIHPQSESLSLSEISDRFDTDLNEGEPPAYAVTMPPQYHIFYQSSPAKSHLFSVRYTVQNLEK